MKNNLNLWIATAAVATIIFTSCSKEESLISDNNYSNDLSIPEVGVLSNQADEEFVNFEISGGTETQAFEIINDGLPDAYQITESTADEINSVKRDGNAKRIRVCLSQVQLSDEQIAKLRRLFSAYNDCKSSIIKRHSNAVRELSAKINARHDELLKLLRAGKISKEEYEKYSKALRSEFKRAMDELAQKSRAALKDCYTKMLRGLYNIMSERQWKAFVNCYRR